MDFDTSKENIQPLRGGRNVAQLGMALQAQSSEELRRELMRQKGEFENAIQTYQGDDPLDNWYHYISWVEQSFPKQGHEGNLMTLLENCLMKFENDERYKNDRRFCRLWIKYIDLQQNPLELYQMMHAKGLCRGCADLYKAWAYYYEATGDYKGANQAFELGKRAFAQPMEELLSAHQNLIMAAGQQVISGINERSLQEKRQALTSLRTYQPGRVGSVRVPASSGAGTWNENAASSFSRPNATLSFYEDGSKNPHGAVGGFASILSVVKRAEAPKENTLKPGTWSAAKLKKVQASGGTRTPSFAIHEDLPSQQGIRLPPQFHATTSEDYSNFTPPLCHLEPQDPCRIPMYPKNKVYGETDKEYSIEEIRASRYKNQPSSRLIVGPTETQQAIQSILSDPMQQSMNDEEFQSLDGVEDKQEVTVDVGVHNEQHLSMQEIQDREVFQTYHQAKEQHNQQELLEHTRHQQQQEQKLHSFREGQLQTSFQIYQSPVHERSQLGTSKANISTTHSPPFQVYQSPQQQSRNSKMRVTSVSPGIQLGNKSTSSSDPFLDGLWNSSPLAEPGTCKFAVREASPASVQPQIQPKGSAMKTPFRTLTAEDLAETGSRGGLDTAATAQPSDGAKRLIEEESNSSMEGLLQDNGEFSVSCNTQMFNFNLNAMKVSTPQKPVEVSVSADSPKEMCKQLFAENANNANKTLSVILEETKSYRSSSSSNSKSLQSQSKFSNMAAMSEQHHNYLAQNMMANAALRSSLLGDLMDCDSPQSSPITDLPPPIIPQKIPYSPVKPLEQAPRDPFEPSLILTLLQRVNFPGRHSCGYQVINVHPRLQVKKEIFKLGEDRYYVEKQLGKGTYGTVFKAVDVRTNRVVALKYQKPPNKWEFYICRELQSRLSHHPLRDRFMDIHVGYFHDQASVLVSDFSPCGSLLDVRNAFKQKTGQSLKQSLCIYFCIDMLRVVSAMHKAQIIHADIKPDNFLVHLVPDGTLTLHLIDFGCSIDMSLFPQGTHFTRCVTTEDFICCEMRDGRPWNYHTDLFCVAATAHALLFDKYIQLQKKDGNWSITQRLSRYMRVDLWNTFFSALLNQQMGVADADSLQAMLSEALQNENSFAGDMRILVNLLKDR